MTQRYERIRKDSSVTAADRRVGRARENGTLAALRRGDSAVIDCIGCPNARAQALRFGMGEGAAVHCITTVPGGPVVLKCGRQEIAVGRGLARRITVREDVA